MMIDACTRNRAKAVHFRQFYHVSLGEESKLQNILANTQELIEVDEKGNERDIDVDFKKITQFLRDIRVGEESYSFLIDSKGKSLFHPQHKSDNCSMDIGEAFGPIPLSLDSSGCKLKALKNMNPCHIGSPCNGLEIGAPIFCI